MCVCLFFLDIMCFVISMFVDLCANLLCWGYLAMLELK